MSWLWECTECSVSTCPVYCNFEHLKKISLSITTLIPLPLQFNGKHNCEYACDISTENLVKKKTKKCWECFLQPLNCSESGEKIKKNLMIQICFCKIIFL